MTIKCACTQCPGHLEFEARDAGRTITCPHCGAETILFIPAGAENRSEPKQKGDCISTNARAAADRSAGKPGPDPGARHIKCTITEDEFGSLHWASKRAGPPGHRAITLAEFMHDAIIEKIRAVAKETVACGGDVPQTIAAVLDARRED